MTPSRRHDLSPDEKAIDVTRLSVKGAALVALIAWILSAAAAWAGFQVALLDLRYENRSLGDRMTIQKERIEEIEKLHKMHEIRIRDLERDMDRVRPLQGVRR